MKPATQTSIFVNKILLFAGCILTLAACKKSDTNNISLAGTYSGKAIFVSSGIVYTKDIEGADFNFADASYTASTHSINPTANSITVTNTGTYQAKTDSITFTPDKIIPSTLQGSQTFLNGTYEYHYEGDSLIITKSYLQFTFNQYRLKKR